MNFEPLTANSFQEFGDVIEVENRPFRKINDGYADRFEHLVHLDIDDCGRPAMSIFRARPVDFPFAIEKLERHPVSSQTFLPNGDSRFLIIVAPPTEEPNLDQMRFFVTNGKQGVNYRRGTWHHFLLTLDEDQIYYVIDRSQPDENTEEFDLKQPVTIDSIPS